MEGPALSLWAEQDTNVVVQWDTKASTVKVTVITVLKSYLIKLSTLSEILKIDSNPLHYSKPAVEFKLGTWIVRKFFRMEIALSLFTPITQVNI